MLEKKAAAEGGEEGESLEDTLGKGTAGNLSLFSQSADFQLLSQSAFSFRVRCTKNVYQTNIADRVSQKGLTQLGQTSIKQGLNS